MKKKKSMRESKSGDNTQECCALCSCSDDDPALFGEKIRVEEHNLFVHYFCLLTSCGIYQRGEDDEGVFGFLVSDIKKEIRRSSRLKCIGCQKKGACVGCNVSNCRRMVHFPCGRKLQFVSQFTGLFPSYCDRHSPSQSLTSGLDHSLPQSCSICLDVLEPVLSYSVLKCPSCHNSWFHRDCVQRQAHSAGLFFFRCTLCNNKENFQEEMIRLGIYIPERDASWEMEENAYSDLLEVYTHCDASICVCDDGRSHSAVSGWFKVIRCQLCGSRGTHRKCSDLRLNSSDWACSVCTHRSDGRASLVSSPQVEQRKSLRCKRHLSPLRSPISSKRSGSPLELLQSLVPKLRPLSVQVEVCEDQALRAGLDLVRRIDFDPACNLSIRFTGTKLTPVPRSLLDDDTAWRYFLKLLVQQIQDCEVFEGPESHKNLRLDSQAVRDDLYFDIGVLLALVLVHGGFPVSFFSRALYQCLFNHPANCPLTAAHMTPDTHITRQVCRIAAAVTLDELHHVMEESRDLLELAGCNQPISSLEEREALVEDLVSFTMITRMQLPLKRFREGLQTLGVFEQVLLFPSLFFEVFCQPDDQLTAQTVAQLFTFRFSERKEKLNQEMPVASFWRHFLMECEVGRSSIPLQDLLRFSTGAQELSAVGLFPPLSISFLHPASSEEQEQGAAGRRTQRRKANDKKKSEGGLFPQSQPGSRLLLLPIAASYAAFKSAMEQAISHHVHLLPSES
ncbi:G2/M phase-specific E3 ubiquitin-protein ligase [Salarias fasciatus]|uniref:G2/M phase-specific E3 ubiquitin-protein ligase n=1 Tax=Salarias fasciatus TaxID=181472 RepID=UPI001176581F|nr:G2/M phase-specific E3 ubiquitin-protein ligase [Salarias fasciatus]